MNGAGNPYPAVSDTSTTALGGFSMGSIVTSVLQSNTALGFDAAIAIDNLHRWVSGDPGSASEGCDEVRTGQLAPTVPALSFAKDEPCRDLPDATQPQLKLPGFLWWRAAGMPSMELVMRGFSHTDFAGKGTEQQHRLVVHWAAAWLDRWLGEDADANGRLLTAAVNGQPVADVLSGHYLSAAYLPGVVDTLDYRQWIQRDHAKPETTKAGGPDDGKRIGERRLRRRGVKFRFHADEVASFHCKLDDHEWHRCSSPKTLKRHLSKGRHAFRVRATDASGNREARPATWRFRVRG